MSGRAACYVALAALSFAAGPAANAHEGMQHVMGVVFAASPQQLQIRTTEGSVESVGLDGDSRYERDGKSAGLADLEPGVRVVVETEDVAGRSFARLVRIGVMDPPEDPHEHAMQPSPAAMHDHAMQPPLVEERTPLSLPHTREGSGTAWQPDATPLYAVHSIAGGWTLMTHGSVFVGYDDQGSDRGDDQFLSVNWLMFMARHPFAGGEFGARVMLSLDPLTVGKDGYPLLLQTGESLDGVPLHDRQHPHDLFMETAVTYSRPIVDALGLQLYAAPAGEPALGPVAFPHRLSAASDPLAPLSHHWQDSSHITFGVLTAGLFTRRAKLEGSWFNGREPDEDRYDFDLRRLDSFSGRLAVNPSPSLSLQVSYGWLDSPEGLEPETSLHRLTISAAHAAPFRSRGTWATLGVWGRNYENGVSPSDAFLVESNLDFDGRNTVFGRVEFVEKSGADLVLPPPDDTGTFDVTSLVLGYLREFGRLGSCTPGIGVRGSINFVHDDLRPFYGTNQPAGVMVFLRLRAARMEMEHGDHGMHMHHAAY